MLLETKSQETPKAELLAEGFTKETSQQFERTLSAVYDAIQRFWWRNQKDGKPALEGDEPTGIEIMTAMGANAQAVYTASARRAQMVIAIAQDLGKPELVDLERLSPPYTLTFAEDGSLASHEAKQTDTNQEDEE